MELDLTYLVKQWSWPWALALCAGLAVALSGVSFLIVRPRKAELAAGASWVEKARALYPLRIVAARTPTLVGMGALFITQMPLRLAGSNTAWAVTVLTCTLSALLATTLGLWLRRGIFREQMPLGEALHDSLVLRLALFPTVPILLVGVMLAPAQLDGRALLVGAGVALAMAVVSLGAQSGLLRVLGMVKPPSPELRRALAEASAKSGVAVRELAQLQLGLANALAFPSGKRVWMTRGAEEVLDHEEKVAVLLHELGHLSEPRTVQGLRVATIVFTGVGSSLFRPFILRSLSGTVAGLGVLIVVSLVMRSVRRRMELHADAHAHHHTEDKTVYAGALEKLYRRNLMPAVMPGSRAAHAHLYDRMLAAGVTPSYPRPPPPSSGRARVSVIFGVLCVTVLAGVFTKSVAVPPSEAWARLRARVMDGERSPELASSLESLAPHMAPARTRRMVFELARAGWCEEASRVVSRANRAAALVSAQELQGLGAQIALAAHRDGGETGRLAGPCTAAARRGLGPSIMRQRPTRGTPGSTRAASSTARPCRCRPTRRHAQRR